MGSMSLLRHIKRKGEMSRMKELTLEMIDGVKIYAFIKKPEGKSIGHIHILHGMAEHVGRYKDSIKFFVEQGYVVSGHDHRGHGKTAQLNGVKGHFAESNGFNRVVEDTYEVITHMQTYDSSLKLILLGHSFGSFVARRFIQVYEDVVDLVVLSGTGGDPGVERYAGQIIAKGLGNKNGFEDRSEFLNSLVFGSFNKKIDRKTTKFDWISANPQLVSDYIIDENCGFIPTTQFFLDLFGALGLIHKKTEVAKIRKTLPILLFSGTDDPVGNYGKAVWQVARQYDDAEIEDVTVLLFEGGRHELLNDSSRVETIKGVLNWIEKR